MSEKDYRIVYIVRQHRRNFWRGQKRKICTIRKKICTSGGPDVTPDSYLLQ